MTTHTLSPEAVRSNKSIKDLASEEQWMINACCFHIKYGISQEYKLAEHANKHGRKKAAYKVAQKFAGRDIGLPMPEGDNNLPERLVTQYDGLIRQQFKYFGELSEKYKYSPSQIAYGIINYFSAYSTSREEFPSPSYLCKSHDDFMPDFEPTD